MATRPAFSTAGKPTQSTVLVQGSKGARSARSGIPTVFKSCQELTKGGKLCGAPPIHGGRTCVGHSRKEGNA